MLYFIGLGLGDEKDITVKGLETVQRCRRIFLDHYTSILPSVDISQLQEFYQLPEGITIEIADRELVESGSDTILNDASTHDVAFLVVGDPFGATTHTDLYLRAIQRSIPVQIIHNTSILNAIGVAGLQLYHFGPTVTMPLWTDKWRPSSPYDKIQQNWQAGLHTLCLLDIKVKEMSEEDLLKGVKRWLPPRFMTVKQAVRQLMESELERGKGLAGEDRLVIGLMRVGGATQRIVVGSMKEFEQVDDVAFGPPLHSLIIPGPTIHELEWKMLQLNMLPESRFYNMTWEQYRERLNASKEKDFK